jgi:acetyl/propionyl-CoA carboxylase alpha subunit
MDATTGLRFHPLELLLSVFIKMAAVIALGVPPEGVLLFEVMLNASSMFEHAAITLPPRLDAALRHTHLVGLHTNVGFLRRVVGSRSFAQADLDTALIEREREALFNAPGLPLRWAVAGAVSHLLAQEAQGQGADPWSHTDGWRAHGLSRRLGRLVASAERRADRLACRYRRYPHHHLRPNIQRKQNSLLLVWSMCQRM